MRKLLIVLVALFFIMAGVTAQNNFKEGYIITSTNDTIYGMIDFRTDKINQQECKLILSGENNPTVYFPNEIAGYRFTKEGKYYVSRNIIIGGQEKTTFVEYLVQGLMDLYYYEDENNSQKYFLFHEDNKPMIAVTKKKDEEVDNKIYGDFKYRGTLHYVFIDYPPIAETTDKADFNQKTMIDFVKKYNDAICTTGEACVVFENKSPDRYGIMFDFSIYTGLQQSEYSFFITNRKVRSNGSKTLFPLIGGQVNISNPRWSKSLSCQLDLSLSKMSDNTGNVLATSSVNESYFTYNKIFDYKAYIFTSKLGIKYTFFKYKVRPVIEGGCVFTKLLSTSATETYIRVDKNSVPLIVYSRDYDLRTDHIGGYLGLGLDYNFRKDQTVFIRFQIDGYFKSDATVSNGEDRIKTLQVKLGYAF